MNVLHSLIASLYLTKLFHYHHTCLHYALTDHDLTQQLLHYTSPCVTKPLRYATKNHFVGTILFQIMHRHTITAQIQYKARRGNTLPLLYVSFQYLNSQYLYRTYNSILFRNVTISYRHNTRLLGTHPDYTFTMHIRTVLYLYRTLLTLPYYTTTIQETTTQFLNQIIPHHTVPLPH
jgi:hypothetical protein